MGSVPTAATRWQTQISRDSARGDEGWSPVAKRRLRSSRNQGERSTGALRSPFRTTPPPAYRPSPDRPPGARPGCPLRTALVCPAGGRGQQRERQAASFLSRIRMWQTSLPCRLRPLINKDNLVRLHGARRPRPSLQQH